MSSIDTDHGSQAITSAMVELGRSLGQYVMAEGAVNAEHAKMLRAVGVTAGARLLLRTNGAAEPINDTLARISRSASRHAA